MSLVSTLKNALIKEAKKQIENKTVSIMKEVIRPYLTTIQATQLQVKAIGVPAENKNVTPEEKTKIEMGSYTAGSKSSNPIDTEVDETSIGSVKLKSSVVPETPAYGIEDTYYVIHNKVMMKYTMDVVVEQLSPPNKKSLDDVKTYKELNEFINALVKQTIADANQAVKDTIDGAGSAIASAGKLPSKGLDTLKNYGDSFTDCFDGIVECGTHAMDAFSLNWRFVSYTVNTVIDITTEGAALAGNPFTSSAAPGYIKKEISQMIMEMNKMQAEGDTIATRLLTSIDKIVKPIQPLQEIITTLNSPTGGVIIAIMFKDNAGKAAELIAKIGTIVDLVMGIRNTMVSAVATSLNLMGCAVTVPDITTGEDTQVGAPVDKSEAITAELQKGVQAAKDAADNYGKQYWFPARDLMANYTGSKDTANESKEYPYVMYTTRKYGIGEILADFEYIDALELLKFPMIDNQVGEIVTKEKFIKYCDSAIKVLTPYHDEYKKKYEELLQQCEAIEAELNNMGAEGDISGIPTLEKA